MHETFGKLGKMKEEVHHLFGDDISKYYIEIMNNISIINKNFNDPANKEYQNSLDWMHAQIEKREMRAKFKKYLDLREYGIDDK